MTKRILSVVLALLMIINVFAITSFAAESDNHASWKLACSNESPKPGDVLSIDVSLQADYVTNTFGALIVYDKNYYEPAESVEGNNIVIASDIVDYGNKTVIMSEKKPAAQAAKLYDASYTDEMRAQYGIAWFSFVFQASKFGDPTSDEIPSYATMTKVATLKLKVKDGASSDGNGLIWMDPVYIQTANGSAKYTFVARGSSEIIGQCTTAAKFGQTVDVSECVLYKAEEQPACQHANTTTINAVAATCTEAGYTGDTYCNDCQQTIAQGSVINALGHNFTSQTKSADYLASDATCTAGATYYYKCSRCTEKDTANTWEDTASKLDHDFTSQTKSADYLASAATCTADATYYYKCSRCTEKDTANTWTDLNSATGHTPGEWTVVNPATCIAKGLKTKSCTVCQTVLEQQDIDMVDHTVVNDPEVPATCLATGLTAGSHCSVCNAVIVAQQVIPLADHTWGDWAVTTPATYTAPGVETRECSVCHETENRDIPQLVDNGADYTAVNEALANIPGDLSVYTQTSVKALNDAVQAIVYNLSAAEQARVDGFAADIQTAIDNLKLIPTTLATYADLDDYIAKFVPATSNRTNGVYDADELAAIDNLIASFDRQLPASEQATVDGYLASLKVAVAALTIDETKAVADFEITTDKTEAVKDDIITVSLKLKTNYPIYTMQVPVIYDASVFQIVTPNASVPKSYLTFTGSLADAYKLDGNHNPASSMYKRNSNPSYWSSQTQYKVAYATWAYDVSINNIPVTLEDGEVIATFQLKVISDTADATGKIFLNSDWIKTATTRGGALAVGRTQGSVISVLDGTKYEIGQTFDLDDAEAIVTLNASHEHIRGAWAIEEDKYVCRCTECGEIVESKDLPLASIASTEGIGTIDVGTTTVINVEADKLVSKVRILNAAGKIISTVSTAEATVNDTKMFTIERAFNYVGNNVEQPITVEYKLGDTWLALDTVSVTVVKPDTGSAAIIAKEGTGNITYGTTTKITLATNGTVDKVALFNSDGNMIGATVEATDNGYVISKVFAITSSEVTIDVKYKTGGTWKSCGSFNLKVSKPVTIGVADVTSKVNVGEIMVGDVTTITVAVTSGSIEKVALFDANGNMIGSTISKDNGVYTLTKTFGYTAGATANYTVKYKANGTWYSCDNGAFSIKVNKEAPVATVVEVVGIENGGAINVGDATTVTVEVKSGSVDKVALFNMNGDMISGTTVVKDGNVYTLSRTFSYVGKDVAQQYKVMYKSNGTWSECTDGTFEVIVSK